MMKIFICLALFFVTVDTSMAHDDKKTRKGVVVYSVSPGHLLKGVGSYFVDTGDRMIRGMGKVITAPFKAKAHFPKPKRYLYQPPILIPGKFIPLPPIKEIKEKILKISYSLNNLFQSPSTLFPKSFASQLE